MQENGAPPRSGGGLIIFLTYLAMCLAVVGLVFMAWLVTWPASAQEPPPQQACQPAQALVGFLDKMFHEKPVFQGAGDSGATVIVTISPGGSWSVLSCTGNVCCLRAGGKTSLFLKGA